jgi:DNA-binding transcriptional regulator YdaS (Cro superfamily)
MSTDLRSILARRGLLLVDFARMAGVNKSTATRWAQKRVPAETVPRVEAATGIPRHELRPDLYAPQHEVAA